MYQQYNKENSFEQALGKFLSKALKKLSKLSQRICGFEVADEDSGDSFFSSMGGIIKSGFSTPPAVNPRIAATQNNYKSSVTKNYRVGNPSVNQITSFSKYTGASTYNPEGSQSAFHEDGSLFKYKNSGFTTKKR